VVNSWIFMFNYSTFAGSVSFGFTVASLDGSTVYGDIF